MTQPQGWIEIAQVDDIDDEEAKSCRVGSIVLALYKVGGTFYATSDICTHAHAHLSDGYIEGDIVECPLHQGRFHIPTGKALSAPVTEDVPTYPVKVEGSKVLVEIKTSAAGSQGQAHRS